MRARPPPRAARTLVHLPPVRPGREPLPAPLRVPLIHDRSWLALLGGLLLGAYALPLLAPPPATWPTQPGDDAGLLTRIFLGVPAWWVGLRLMALACGAGLLAVWLRDAWPLRAEDVDPGDASAGDARGSAPHEAPSRILAGSAVAVAAAHAIVGAFLLDSLDRRLEALYLLALLVPGALFALPSARRAAGTARRFLPAFSVLPALWLVWSAPTAWGSPRAASIVDGWLMIERLADVASGRMRMLSDSAIPGFTNAYMALQGVVWMGEGARAPSFEWVQVGHLWWAAACSILVALLVQNAMGRAASLVAQAAFLFSPFVLSFPYNPIPSFLGPLLAALLLLLLLDVHRRSSPAALAALGAIGGFAARIPQLSPLALLVALLLLASLWRSRRVPWAALAAGTLSGLAALLPGLPTPDTIVEANRQFASSQGQAVPVEEILFGQASPLGIEAALTTGDPRLLDLALGALLSPFAIVREPMRLWGDTLLDPIGASLAAVGLALCLMRWRTHGTARLLLLLLLAGMGTAFVAAGDRVSHTRLAPATVPLVVLAAIGFEALRRRLTTRSMRRAFTGLTLVSIAGGGLWIFEAVNPSILPGSSLAISVEALADDGDAARAVILEHGGRYDLSWLHNRRIPEQLLGRAIPVRTLAEFEAADLAAQEPPDALYFWSPGLESDAPVSRAICQRWPSAALYTLADRPGLFRALAADPRGDRWRPTLPRHRWSVERCSRT